MSTADELKKYKELLDQGVLTQTEFDQKKQELLGAQPISTKPPQPAKPKKKGAGKKILLVLLALVVAAAAVLGIRAWGRHTREQKRIAAVDEKVGPILAEYGLNDYEIFDVGVFTEIRCPAFEEMSSGEQLVLLKELNDLDDIPDPVEEDREIELDTNHIYVDKSSAYYYYISESTYNTRKTMRDVMGYSNVNVEVPGLYLAGVLLLSD